MDVLKFAEYNLLSFAQREEIRSLAVKSLTRATQAHILERLGYELPAWKLKSVKTNKKVSQKR